MAQVKERSSFFGSHFISRAAKTGLSLPRNQMETLLRRPAAYGTRKCCIKKSNVEPRTNIDSTLGYALPSILSEQFKLNSSPNNDKYLHQSCHQEKSFQTTEFL